MRNLFLIKLRYIIIFILISLFGCNSSNNDSNKIIKEIQIYNQYFIGKRSADQLVNIYTKELKSGFWSDDTIRHYLLGNWTNIEYWDGEGGFLLFKNFQKTSSDGLKIPISIISNITDSYLVLMEDNIIKDKKKEEQEKEESFNKENFDVMNCPSDQIWEFIQGDWHGWDHPITGFDVYYKMNINGKHIKVEKYEYIAGQSDRFSNWDNAPFNNFLNCDFSGNLIRRIVPTILEISSTNEVKQEEGRAYLELGSTCEDEFKLFLGNPAQMYKDEKKDLEVNLKAETVGWNAVFSKGASFNN